MIDPECLRLLRRHGYTEREAEFLCLVGDVGGYFLRRHYRRFLNQKRGRPEAELARKLREKRHARVYIGAGGIDLYHLCPRRFYRAIGRPESRNRRQRSVSSIKKRLLTLDYVVAHRDFHYLLTDAEKRTYLTEQRGLSPEVLPAKDDLFLERFPLHIPARLTVPRRVVSFCYVDPHVFSARRFGSFLERQRRLWFELREFQLIYISDRRWNPGKAERAFREFCERHWPQSKVRQESIHERILRAFRTDQGIRTGGISDPNRSHFAEIERAKAEFSAERYDSLFATWRLTSDQTVYDLVDPDPHQLWPKGVFIARLIAENYRFLDSASGT